MSYFVDTTEEASKKWTGHYIMHIRAINILILVTTTWLYVGHVQAAPSSKSGSLIPLNRFPRMVQEYFVKSVHRIEQQANQRRAALKTRADAEAYVREVGERIQQSFGPWPENTPPGARCRSFRSGNRDNDVV